MTSPLYLSAPGLVVPGSLGWTPFPTIDPAPPVSPTDIPGLVGWWRASSLALASGDPVASWTDESGNGFHWLQATPEAQPTYIANVINGQPAVRFAGDIDAMALTG